VGVERTSEELGRAFPGRRVVTARAGADRAAVEGPVLVVATAGSEPPAQGGYAAAVLLDPDRLLDRPGLAAGEEAIGRWRAAAALVRSSAEGGVVVLAATSAHPAVESFLRGSARGYARRELLERSGLRLPPTVAAATVQGSPSAVKALARVARWPEGTEVLGPVEVEVSARRAGEPPEHRLILRAAPEAGLDLAKALAAAAAVRSTRRDGDGQVRIKVNPRDVV
jgi:primosomal protein N' (replication factor Y)